LKPVTYGDSSQVQVGETAVAIGNPLGQEGTLTAGVISAINRSVFTDGNLFFMIQTDAAINPGNSGGPLVNRNSEVIGISTLKQTTAKDEFGKTIPAEGIGFAIPINVAKPYIRQLIADGKASHPSIGIVGYTELDRQNKPIGVKVSELAVDGAALVAGIKKDDIIVSADNQSVSRIEDLVRIISAKAVGEPVIVKVLRGDKEINFEVILKEFS
ncbi:MAG TPA: trypsin-like peptidase domain-containing protein, partial [Clostridia bacterium]|nr:trypsin-like peptidase domain-containing protein [Clostridia bacterium]